jgi:hypothetical protein
MNVTPSSGPNSGNPHNSANSHVGTERAIGSNIMATKTSFTKWLDRLVDEKGLDLEQAFEVQGPSGYNRIPLGCVIDAIKSAPTNEQAGIKTMLVKIDFHNGNVAHYFGHLAQAIAV